MNDAYVKKLENNELFNGYCGAESGSIPVSCVAPMVLVKMIETQKYTNLEIIMLSYFKRHFDLRVI